MGKLYRKETSEKEEGWALIEAIERKPKKFITGAGLFVMGILVFIKVTEAMA